MWTTLITVTVTLHALISPTHAKPPNIIFIISDDQDALLGSLNHMSSVQTHIISSGLNLRSHYGTVALCCPARATLMRGQSAHNTNVTHVGGPAGAWPKFLSTGEARDYLPHWLQKAGYRTGYFGKFMNGYGMRNYDSPPGGWDVVDLLCQPFIYAFNRVIMSRNGEKPKHYKHWHQTDVLRVKALEELEVMTEQEKPFYLEIAPASPHVRIGGWPTVPLARHMFHFPGVTAPRMPNFNPLNNELQKGKGSWIGRLPLMDDETIEIVDRAFRARLQGLQGVDEIVEDIISLLERKGVLDETFIIYTTDNGFHLGTHRIPSGKGTPYIEDVNLPLAVRGPGIPRGKVSSIPSSHVDMAPTILDIAGVPSSEWPEFFDGRSLLPEWRDPEYFATDRTTSASSTSSVSSNSSSERPDSISREVINVEFWGTVVAPAEKWTQRYHDNTYKSLRIVSPKGGWLFNRWCTANQTELYDTLSDPYELRNLAINASGETKRIMSRLSGLLLVTKSCAQESCRRPWEVLRSACGIEADFGNLEEAMDPKYDSFFSGLPDFGFQECLPLQKEENEGPYFPPESQELGRRFRETEIGGDGDVSFWMTNSTLAVGLGSSEEGDMEGEEWYGDVGQRFAGWDDLEDSAMELTDEEVGWPTVECRSEEDCEWIYDD